MEGKQSGNIVPKIVKMQAKKAEAYTNGNEAKGCEGQGVYSARKIEKTALEALNEYLYDNFIRGLQQ